MILTCQNCSTSFRLEERLLKPSGSKVRCSRCKHIWRARPSAAGEVGSESRTAIDGQPDHGAAAVAGVAAGAGMAAMLMGDDQAADETAEAAHASAAAPAPPELKLGLDDLSTTEKLEDDGEMVTDEVNLDDLDLMLEDEPLASGPAPDDDFQTEELDLADLEQMLDGDVDESAAPETPPPTPAAEDLNTFEEETEDSIIENLDLDMADLESLLEDDVDLGGGHEASALGDTADDEAQLDIAPGLEDLLEDDVPELDLEETEEIGLVEVGDPAVAAAATTPPDDGINLELAPGIDSLFDEVEDQDIPLDETEELDFSALGDELDQLDQVAEAAAEEPGALDLDRDAGQDTGSAAPPPSEEDNQAAALSFEDEGQSPAVDEIEELDLSDLESVLEEGSAEPSTLSPGEEQPELVLELDGDTDKPIDAGDINLVLDDLDLGTPDPSEQSDIEETRELNLDELELDLDLETPDPSEQSDIEETRELNLDDLELDLDLETPDPSAQSDMEETRELNLDELELDLETPDPSAPSDVEETRDLDLDDLESLLDDADAPSAAAPEASVEGLDLDLDLDGDLGAGEEEPDDATRELNLDDIEKILEAQEATPTAPSIDERAEEELELDIGDDATTPEATDAHLLGGDETPEGSDSLDLSELEKMLDVEDTTDSPSLPADEAVDDLDLDFELQPTIDEEDELELEFDMLEDEGEEPSALFDTSESEDLNLELDTGETPAPEKVALEEDLALEIMDGDASDELVLDVNETDADDLDLDILENDADDIDLDILDDDAAPAAAPVEMAAKGVAGAAASRDLTQELMDEMAAADTQTMDIPPVETKPTKPAPEPPKKKSNKLLVLLLLLVLLGAGAYFLFTATGSDLSKFKLSDLPQIPFVSEWLGLKKAPEAIVPVETTLKGSWVQNNNDGRLYIIQGHVKNEYSQPRSYIRVTGRIFADGRKFKRAAQAYCGNMPSREDLENLPMADLQKRLANRNGANNVNVKVAPGKEVPFTVVFAGLPEDVELQEYAVEISGSLPVTNAKSK